VQLEAAADVEDLARHRLTHSATGEPMGNERVCMTGNDKQVAAVSTVRSIEYNLTSSLTAWGAMAAGIDLLRSHVPNGDRLLELLFL
jgi:hypothetical protein